MAAAMNARAARFGLNGRLAAEDLGAIYMRDRGACHYCDFELRSTECSFDHVLPFVRGGENIPDNIVVSCMTDQREKASRLSHEFAEAQKLEVSCEVCGRAFKPRYADYRRGYGRTCSASCAGLKGRKVRAGQS